MTVAEAWYLDPYDVGVRECEPDVSSVVYGVLCGNPDIYDAPVALVGDVVMEAL